MVKKNVETRQARLDAARRFWMLKVLSAVCYVCGGVFVAVMAAAASSPLGKGLAGVAACLFIICGRMAGGEKVE